MSAREYARWVAYARVEPIGDQRADLRMAILANAVARSMGGKTRPADFIVDYWRLQDETLAARAENIVARLRVYASAHNTARADHEHRDQRTGRVGRGPAGA